MSRKILSAEVITQALRGQQVSHVTLSASQQFVIHFAGGVTLVADAGTVELTPPPREANGALQPTQRQFEYLAFIHKYIGRFGGAPAESDIQRHFLVSAPTVNQMMQTLERLGFIARQRGVARSIRICIALPSLAKQQ